MSGLETLQARQAGLTLIELIMTIAVFVVVVSTAGPALQKVLSSNRTVSQVNTLLGDLNFTRSEAIKRGEQVTICQSSNQSSCTSSKDEWHKGWIVKDASGALLRVHGALRGGTTLKFNHDKLSYKGDGTATGLVTGTFTFCDSSSGTRPGKALKVSATGRVRKSPHTCS